MTIGAISYSVAAALFLVLAVLLLTSWRGRLHGVLLGFAVTVSALWAMMAVYLASTEPSPALVSGYLALEVGRNGLWFAFLLSLLAPLKQSHQAQALSLRFAGPVLGVFSVLVCAADLLTNSLMVYLPSSFGLDLRILGHLVLAIAGLALVEQLFRNTRPDQRWAVKYLFLGIGALFTYDFFLYSDALLFKRIDAGLWQARGFINALVVPLVAISAARNPEWSLDVFISRKVVFHTVTLVGAGVYLIFMAGVGYYIRIYGGAWGTTAQVAFLFLSVILLIMLLFSGQLRTRVKVFLNKNFFNYKYDYREEWLKLIHTLALNDDSTDLRRRAIRALADIADSTGGMIWLRNDAGRYQNAAHWNMNEPVTASLAANSALVRMLAERRWVIDLYEYAREPERYPGLELPAWLQGMERAWLVVPLILDEVLIGFIVLSQPRAPRPLNWEDRDLLKTVGMQLASYVALLETSEALMNARQFEAFNRLSSYVVHDLKNVAAQLALVVTNAERHRHNPAFIDDAINTVSNATQKMNRMLAQLRKGGKEDSKKSIVELEEALKEAVTLRSVLQPVPTLAVEQAGLLLIDHDKLVNVLAHLIHNAQESTNAQGSVKVRATQDQEYAVIEIIDDGCGMDEQFIRERLFRPFDTTKGNAGMGIGAYESREFVWSQGGDMVVESLAGVGTTFRIRLPLYRDVAETGSQEAVVGEGN